jgi:hypothetical protein
MGWGLIVNGVYINKVTKSQIEIRIEECESMIEYCRENLIALAAACPRDIEQDGEMLTWEDHVTREVRRNIEEIVDKAGLLHLLYVAKETDEENLEEDY